jgi:hypothetical protein
MQQTYEVVADIAALAAAKTLIFITANKLTEIIYASVTNADTEASEQIECSIHKVETLGSPVGTAVTPTIVDGSRGTMVSGVYVPHPAAATVKVNLTVEPTTYTSAPAEEIGHEGGPSVGGWYYSIPDKARKKIPAGESWGLRLLSTPMAFNAVARVVFREIG